MREDVCHIRWSLACFLSVAKADGRAVDLLAGDAPESTLCTPEEEEGVELDIPRPARDVQRSVVEVMTMRAKKRT